jgi:hypothetical protein
MRVKITARDSADFININNLVGLDSNLYYESAMPGGMTVAGCRIPLRERYTPRLQGCKFEVYDGANCVWWGRITDVTDTVQKHEHYVDLVANAPWGLCAQRPFSQDYQSGCGMVWTANEIIKAAVFGNVEDVLIQANDWDSTCVNLVPISWTDTTVQTVIGDCLRLGGDTTAPWTFLIEAPKTQYSQTGNYLFTNDGESDTFDYRIGASVSEEQYRHGHSSFKFVAAASAAGCVRRDLPATCTQYFAAAWFYIPRSTSAMEHDFFYFRSPDTGEIARVSSTSANIIYAHTGTGLTYGAYMDTTFGLGCWHWISLFVVCHSASGTVRVNLDGKNIVYQTDINTGGSVIDGMFVGMARTESASRLMYMDDVVMSRANVIGYYGKDSLATETLPVARLVQTDLTTYDFIVDLAEIDNSYRLDCSLRNVANQIDGTHKTGNNDPVFDKTSIKRYGQLQSLQSTTKTANPTINRYVQNRYLEQYSEPTGQLQSFKITKEPTKIDGTKLRLPYIKAGMRFKIRQLPERGIMYVGQTKYTRGESNQEESCTITPSGAPSTLDIEIIRRSMRTWS